MLHLLKEVIGEITKPPASEIELITESAAITIPAIVIEVKLGQLLIHQSLRCWHIDFIMRHLAEQWMDFLHMSLVFLEEEGEDFPLMIILVLRIIIHYQQ